MKLSIIIPVYNVEKYIEKCLNSLCNLETENEIIVVNDGSTDFSLKIAEEFKKNHDNENIIIISQENKGLSEARNTGLRKAKGEYVSFIDSDDFVDKKLYEMMIKEVIKDKVDYGIGKYSYCYENDDKKQYNDNEIKDIIGKFQLNPLKKGKEWLKILKKEDKYGPEVWDDIYKREFLVKNNLFFKPDRLHEDEIFTLEAFLKAERVKYYAIPFYCYLQRENSIMKTQKVKNFTDMQKNIFDMENLLSEEKNDKDIQ
ncbi:MAG: glycosyltransferase, partial [Pseudoleptotrichia goodfellowii]|nr:glycosyltransferase [Pseudoleptotrichia goodfellowii]